MRGPAGPNMFGPGPAHLCAGQIIDAKVAAALPDMANIHSQKKRILRSERERLENRRYTSRIKTYFRRLERAVAAGEDSRVEDEHRELVRTIDKAVKRGAIHRNAGARKKSRAARLRHGD